MSSDQTATVVVAAVIVQDKKVLIHQRGAEAGREPSTRGWWECPGGVVLYGENFMDAVKREIREELNLHVDVRGLLHAQINTYDGGPDYLVLFYECSIVGHVEYLSTSALRFIPISTFPLGLEVVYDTLPGTVEAVDKLRKRPSVGRFSFVENDVANQTPGETLHILTYNLGKVIEYYHKAKRYGATDYCSDSNQQKEMGDLVSMCRMYCEQKGWNYQELLEYGEVCYVERMDDLRKHGVQNEPRRT